MHKLFWHIIPRGNARESFGWGVSTKDFSVPLSQINTKIFGNGNYWLYEGQVLEQAALVTYIFDNQSLKRARVEFQWDKSLLSNRRQVVEKLLNHLRAICGAPVSGDMARYYEQGLVSWIVEDTSLVLGISTYKIVLNAFPTPRGQPLELDNDLSGLIDEMAQVFLRK